MCALLLLLQLYLYRYLLAENLMLRHQHLVYKRSMQKPRIKQFDRILWVLLTTILSDPLWKNALAIVKPATVIKWHREATWGPERILGELHLAGYRIHINTVRKYLPKRTKTPGGSWKSFLDPHISQIAAMDFFVVPMWNFTPLYVFFIIHHATREILQVNVSAHPGMDWLRQNLKEAFADFRLIH